jgi:hypothetical protein
MKKQMLKHGAAASLPLWRSSLEHAVVAPLQLEHAKEDKRGLRHARVGMGGMRG